MVCLAQAAAVLASMCTAPAQGLVQGPWSDKSLDPDSRAQTLVSNMTLDEKLLMLHGPTNGNDDDDWAESCNFSAVCAYVGNVAANARLDIPPITMNDGPQGFRDDLHPGTTTAWPSGLTMAASWDYDALRDWGDGMGKEFYAKGANVQLGPGLCVARVPRNGRNFEYMSGEDPFLGYYLVQPVIAGIQQNKVVANAKHWILNNEEHNRQAISDDADERTRFEMYYPPFMGAIQAGVGSVMCSYNKIYGKWSCENPDTLAGDLKSAQGLGFKGYVMSDWGATHSTSIMAGMDIEMPTADHMNPAAIKAGIAAGTITEAKVTDSVLRILRSMFDVGVMDEPTSAWDWKKLEANTTSEDSVAMVRKLSAVSTVLLKNAGGILPLPKGQRLAIIGLADAGAVVHGGGSGSVTPSYIVPPLQGIRAQAGEGATVTFNNGTDIAAAAALAAASDYAVVFAGTLSHEGADRDSLSLDSGCVYITDTKHRGQDSQCKGNAFRQNELIAAIAKANAKTTVVLSVPGAVLLPWSHEVGAILTNFLPGQQAGNAIADVLFGAVNPSGKLPITFPNKENETNFSPAQWPGLPNTSMPAVAVYSEKLLVGYRYYDAHGIDFDTGFPFGHGLSYTTFAYSSSPPPPAGRDGSAPPLGVGYNGSFVLTNTGKVAGAEVAQMYLAFPPQAGEPPKVLRRFKKVALQPGASATVEFDPLVAFDFSVWDTTGAVHGWKVVPGDYTVMIGTSSRDLPLVQHLTIS